MIAKITVSLIVALLLCCLPAMAENLAGENAGFEIPVVDNGNGFQYYGGINPVGWTLSGTGNVLGGPIVDIFLAGGLSFQQRLAAEGQNFLYLDGWWGGGWVPNSWPTISKTIATTVGATYKIKFAACTYPGMPATMLSTVVMKFGSLEVTTPIIDGYDQHEGGWTLFEYTAVASSSSTIMSFSRGESSACIDDISVETVAVPEPSGLVTLVMGMAPFAGLLLRRRQN